MCKQGTICIQTICDVIADSNRENATDDVWPRLANLECVPCHSMRGAYVFCSRFMSNTMTKHADEIVERFELTASDVFTGIFRRCENGRGLSHSATLRLLSSIDPFKIKSDDTPWLHMAIRVLRDREINQEWFELYDVCVKAFPRYKSISFRGINRVAVEYIWKWSRDGINPVFRLLSPLAWSEGNAAACNRDHEQLLQLIGRLINRGPSCIVWSFLC